MGEGTDITESLQLMVQQAKFNFKTMEGGQKIAQFISETIRPEIVFFY